MEHLPLSEAQWFRQQLKPWPPADFSKEGTTVDNLIPSGYESYGKLLHPFEVNREEPDTLGPHPNYGKRVNIAISNTPDGGISITEQKPDGTVVDLREEASRREEKRRLQTLVPTPWRTIAQKYGLTFHEEINTGSYAALFQHTGWPRNLLFPSEGFLPRQPFLQLLSLLKEHTPGGAVYIFQYPPHTLFKEGRTEDLVRCHLEEVPAYFEEDFIGYLFAADRSWMVHTNTDFHFTLVGGNQALLAALESSELEVLECRAATRVDDYSDRINAPPHQPAQGIPAPQQVRPPQRHSIFSRLKQWLARR